MFSVIRDPKWEVETANDYMPVHSRFLGSKMQRCVGEEEIKMLKMRGRFSFVNPS